MGFNLISKSFYNLVLYKSYNDFSEHENHMILPLRMNVQGRQTVGLVMLQKYTTAISGCDDNIGDKRGLCREGYVKRVMSRGLCQEGYVKRVVSCKA